MRTIARDRLQVLGLHAGADRLEVACKGEWSEAPSFASDRRNPLQDDSMNILMCASPACRRIVLSRVIDASLDRKARLQQMQKLIAYRIRPIDDDRQSLSSGGVCPARRRRSVSRDSRKRRGVSSETAPEASPLQQATT